MNKKQNLNTSEFINIYDASDIDVDNAPVRVRSRNNSRKTSRNNSRANSVNREIIADVSPKTSRVNFESNQNQGPEQNQVNSKDRINSESPVTVIAAGNPVLSLSNSPSKPQIDPTKLIPVSSNDLSNSLYTTQKPLTTFSFSNNDLKSRAQTDKLIQELKQVQKSRSLRNSRTSSPINLNRSDNLDNFLNQYGQEFQPQNIIRHQNTIEPPELNFNYTSHNDTHSMHKSSSIDRYRFRSRSNSPGRKSINSLPKPVDNRCFYSVSNSQPLSSKDINDLISNLPTTSHFDEMTSTEPESTKMLDRQKLLLVRETSLRFT